MTVYPLANVRAGKAGTAQVSHHPRAGRLAVGSLLVMVIMLTGSPTPLSSPLSQGGLRGVMQPGAAIWVYGAHEESTDQINAYNASQPDPAKRIRYLFGYVCSLNVASVTLSPYHREVSAFYAARCPGVEVHPMLDSAGGIEDYTDAQLDTLARRIADAYHADPHARGIHFDIEPYSPRQAVLTQRLRALTTLPITLAVSVLPTPPEQWQAADAVVLMNYDLAKTPAAYERRAAKKLDRYVREAHAHQGRLLVGVPALATHTEYAYTVDKSSGTVATQSGYAMEDFLAAGLRVYEAARSGDPRAASGEVLLGVSIWGLVPPGEPVGSHPVDHPTLYYPAIISATAWELLRVGTGVRKP